MAYYRRRTYRRRPYRPRVSRKRTYRRKYSRFGKRKASTGVYYFKRKSTAVYDWVTNTQLTQIKAGAGGSDTWANIGFRLIDIPGYTDFGMYDQFRIAAVKVNFIPVSNMSTWPPAGSTGTIQPGSFALRTYTAFDPNADGSGVMGVGDVIQYQNAKWTTYNKIHKRYVKPKVMLTVDGVGGSNMPGKQPWIQNNAVGQPVVYYGIPFAMDPTSAGAGTILYNIECTYYLQFKMPK